MRILLAALPLTLLAADTLDTTRALPVVNLKANTHHVQGIELHKGTLWLTSVEVKTRQGHLFQFHAKTGKLIREIEVQQADRFHPGGIQRDGQALWIPVAEYKRASTATIQKRDAKTLALLAEFPAQDHIGAIAVTPDSLIGANWNAEQFYVWTKSGQLKQTVNNPTGVAIQDMKFVNGVLIAGGLLKDGSGAIVWLSWPGLKELRRVTTGKTDRGVALTHEGLAVVGKYLYLLPEDSPSRLFAFETPTP
jgi:hypothetical protein